MSNREPASRSLGWDEVDAALRALLALESEAQSARLDALMQSDPALAQRLLRLLGAAERLSHLESSEFIEGVAMTALERIGRSRSGQRLGAWLLGDPIGTGGMAEVYLATRAIESDQQTAAIKLVYMPNTDRNSGLLVREAQVLARLSDPRIARLLDFGRSDAGEPWVAMEYVDGQPIDRWCHERDATVRERVRLMINVAMAVDHAHRNLVVHRDIKPGNVFVSRRDGGIKLLDFGIARALPGPGRDVTRTALHAYTEAYASPEQLAGETAAVASDIYQLGQLLYLLLAGVHPFAHVASNPSAQLQARETGPVAPRSAARAGGADARRRSRQIDVDLETIVLKAMEYRIERRYLGAHDFADDLRRWLDGKAISARRGRIYRTGRLLRRHWGLTAVVMLSLVLLGSYVANLRDRESLLEAQRLRTERILDVAVEVLNESDPYLAAGSSELTDASLQRIRARLDDERTADPEFRARILSLLASVHARRGQNRLGLELSQQALAVASEARLDEALVAEIALATARQLSTLSLNAEAIQVLDAHRIALQRYARLPVATLRARIELQRGDATRARARLEEIAADLGPGPSLPPEARALLNQLAIVRGEQGERDASIEAAERAFTGFEPKSGREIASWMSYAMNLAVAYGEARRYREADALHRHVAEWGRRTLGADHPQVAIVERSRAIGLIRVARFRDALAVLDGARTAAARLQLPMHRVSFMRAHALASLYSGQPARAFEDLLEADGIARRELSDLPGERPRIREELAWTLFELGAYPQAAQVAARIPADTTVAARRGAALRLVLRHLATTDDRFPAAEADRELARSHHCTAALLEAFEAALAPPRDAPLSDVPATCDGLNGALAQALGAPWVPDWRVDFPPPEFESMLALRLRARDLQPRPLEPKLQSLWNDWLAAQAGAP